MEKDVIITTPTNIQYPSGTAFSYDEVLLATSEDVEGVIIEKGEEE